MRRLLIIALGILLSTRCSPTENWTEQVNLSMLDYAVDQEILMNNAMAMTADNGSIIVEIEFDSVPLIISKYNYVTHQFQEVSETWLIKGDTMDLTSVRKGLLRFFQILAEKLVIHSGGYDEEGDLVGASNTEVPRNIFFSESGESSLLTERISIYLRVYHNMLDTEWEDPFLEPPKHPYFRNNPRYNRKSFAELYFLDCSTIIALQRISHLQLRVLNLERLHYLPDTGTIGHEI